MEFIAGTLAGVAITFSGHPFDTIKVRMQAGHVHNLFQCIRKTIQADGFLGLYQGLASPLYSVPLLNAVIFGAYAQAQWFLGDEQSLKNGLLGGAWAGLVNCIIVCPAELAKCKVQIQSADASLGLGKQFNGSIECAIHILKHEGIRELNRGMVATILREVPAYAAQFSGYEFTKAYLTEKVGGTPMWVLFVAGMAGGLNCWIWSYPQDVIKTRLQVGPKMSGLDGGFFKVGKQIYQEAGLMGFWRGFSACALRACIANGFGFLTYEISMQHLRKHFS